MLDLRPFGLARLQCLLRGLHLVLRFVVFALQAGSFGLGFGLALPGHADFLCQSGLLAQGGLTVVQQGAAAFVQDSQVAAYGFVCVVQLRRLAMPGIQLSAQALQLVAKADKALANALVTLPRIL